MEAYYVGLDAYDRHTADALCGDPEVKGLVLGDLLCTKRMFAGGIAEEIRTLERVMESGKEILYQTPLYVTGRNWEEVFSILNLLGEAPQVVHVITEDFGVASAVRERFPSMKLVWGRMGRGREYRFTNAFFRELKNVGFLGMETEQVPLAQKLAGQGLRPYLVYGSLCYQTVGRVCYMEYQTGACNREACLQGSYRLKERNGPYGMSIDGYLMGETLHCGPVEELRGMAEAGEAFLTVYARSAGELRQRAGEWRQR